jgi:hypothetical protein
MVKPNIQLFLGREFTNVSCVEANMCKEVITELPHLYLNVNHTTPIDMYAPLPYFITTPVPAITVKYEP